MRYILLLLCTMTSYSLFAQNYSLVHRDIEIVADGYIVTYTFPDAPSVESAFFPNTYYWDMTGAGINTIQGEPLIPIVKDSFIIPNDSTSNISIVDTLYTTHHIIMSPCNPYTFDNDSISPLTNIRPYTGYFPSTPINTANQYNYRRRRFQDIELYPVQYDYVNNIARKYSMIKYHISFSNSNMLINDTLSPSEDYALERLIQNRAINSNVSLYRNNIIGTSNQDSNYPIENGYLIITTDEYVDSLRNFIEWKKIKGKKVYLESRQKGRWHTNEIQSVIQNHFHNHGISYVLIVGGNEDVPGYIINMGNQEKNGVSDFEYSLPISNNPQLLIGRLPVDNLQELSIVVNKIISYEKTPITNEAFYTTGLNCAYFDDELSDYGNICNGYETRAFVLTSENIRDHMMDKYGFTVNRVYTANKNGNICVPTHLKNGDPLPDELLMPNFMWNGGAPNVNQRINEGCMYVLHRGHGGSDHWVDPYFWVSNVAELTNGSLQPILFSINCETGAYQKQAPCLAEAVLEMENGGCIATFAATADTQSYMNNHFALGIFETLWPNIKLTHPHNNFNDSTYICTPTCELGQIMLEGMRRMSCRYPTEQLFKTLYHCFGDPSMMLFTETPKSFLEPSVFFEEDSICVYTYEKDCIICVYNKSKDTIHTFIGNYAKVQCDSTDNIIVCLDKHNYIPYVWNAISDNIFIQNENIVNTSRKYAGRNTYIGNNVTSNKPFGNVQIDNSNISINAQNVKITNGTKINNSNVVINKR